VEQGSGSSREEFRVCDQYTIQGDLFSLAVLGKGHTPTPLENSLGNMQVIEALFESERTSTWVRV
jgi:hypothetical protein